MVIFTSAHVTTDFALNCDLCVVGSGAGGSPVAWEVSRQGKRVIVLEAGSFLRPRDFSQLEHEMFPRLYHDGAGRTNASGDIHVHQGKGLGGSTLHNLNVCKRLPAAVWARWREEQQLSLISNALLEELYGEVEERLSVRRLEEGDLNGNNQALRRGCEKLGYAGGYLSHNRVECRGSGFCELGCPFDAKQNALKCYIAPAVEKGALVLCDTWAVGLRHSGRRVAGVEGVVRDAASGAVRHRVEIRAKVVCLSAGATATPALLQSSRVPDPEGLVGSRLFLHPGAAVAGIFRERMNSWSGIPQGFECTQFLDHADPGKRVWIVPAFAHPAGTSAVLGSFGEEHADLMELYPHMGALSAMVHDESPGRVAPREPFGVTIHYRLGRADREQLALGLRESARLLLASGARRVIVPLAKPLEVERLEDVDSVLGNSSFADPDLTAVHPMGSVWMGDDSRHACVDTAGRLHQMENLFVADASLFPTSTGVPPQLTTYALGHHVGRRIAAELG